MHHLGVAGVKEVKGLKVAFMASEGRAEDVIKEARKGRVHLLLTTQWPQENDPDRAKDGGDDGGELPHCVMRKERVWR